MGFTWHRCWVWNMYILLTTKKVLILCQLLSKFNKLNFVLFACARFVCRNAMTHSSSRCDHHDRAGKIHHFCCYYTFTPAHDDCARVAHSWLLMRLIWWSHHCLDPWCLCASCVYVCGVVGPVHFRANRMMMYHSLLAVWAGSSFQPCDSSNITCI